MNGFRAACVLTALLAVACPSATSTSSSSSASSSGGGAGTTDGGNGGTGGTPRDAGPPLCGATPCLAAQACVALATGSACVDRCSADGGCADEATVCHALRADAGRACLPAGGVAAACGAGAPCRAGLLCARHGDAGPSCRWPCAPWTVPGADGGPGGGVDGGAPGDGGNGTAGCPEGYVCFAGVDAGVGACFPR